jgi:hypothetical protein
MNEQENKDAKIKTDLSIYTEILATRLGEGSPELTIF